MADTPNIPTDAAGIQQFINAFKSFDMNKAAAAYAEVGQKVADLTKALSGMVKGHRDYIDTSKELASVKLLYGELGKQMSGVAAAIVQANSDLKSMDKQLENTGLSGFGLSGSMRDLTKSLLGAGAAGAMLSSQAGKALLQPFSDANLVANLFGRSMNELNEVFRKNAEFQNMVNTAMLGTGMSMAQIDKQANRVMDAIQKTTAQFFFSGQVQNEFLNTVRAVPGVMKDAAEESGRTGRSMTNLAEVLLVAKGAGIESAEAARMLDSSYKTLGSGKMADVTDMIVKFKNAAAEGGTTVQIAGEQIQAASQPFAMFSKRLAEANDLWVTFQKSLGDKVGPKAVGDLLNAASSGLATMSLNNQAFVAQMSGMARGMSALGGALRMEQEMTQEGGAARNLERVQQAVSKMTGGRIVTREEAIQSPALETQFQMQRTMAGQMLGIQGGAQQSRLMEVLQGIEKGGISSAKAEADLKSLASDGQKAQGAATTAMEQTAMGVSRTNELLVSLADAEGKIKEQLAGIGKALGARSVGARQAPEERAGDWAQVVRSLGRAGRTAMQEGPHVTARIGQQIESMGKGVQVGASSLRNEREYATRMSAGGPVIDVGRPRERLEMTELERELEKLLATTQRISQPRPEPPRLPGELFFNRSQAIEQARTPAAPGEEPEAPRRTRRGIREAEEAPPPLEINVNTTCPRCLEKMVKRYAGMENRAGRGDDHTNEYAAGL
jgi:hypothetical protein